MRETLLQGNPLERVLARSVDGEAPGALRSDEMTLSIRNWWGWRRERSGSVAC
jgi:hypothetical protein